MTHEESSLNPKEVVWEEKLRSLENIVDRIGRHIDKEIMETLVAFDVSNIPTDSSCGGHLETERMRFPYVSGEANGRPQYAYVGQADIENEIAKKHGINQKEIRDNIKAKKEYRARLEECELSEEFKVWRTNDQALPMSVAALLEEFYQTRGDSMGVRLCLRERMAIGYYMVTDNYLRPKETSKQVEATQEELDEIKAKIIDARAEFKAFADFLKQKFLTE